MPTLFLTGASGFIGSSLLEKWLVEEPSVEIAVLVRQRHDLGPQTRIGRILAEIFPGADTTGLSNRVQVVEGDIALDRFGLPDSAYSDLARRVSHIVHGAAAVRFDLTLDEARATNVTGARSILGFARACPNLARLDYVGTAYVAGKRKGTILEDELDLGQEHNNTYERTKMECELLMREAWHEIPIAVHRPSIVVCDSATGRTSPHSAIYRMLRAYRQGLVAALPGYPSTLLDIVPSNHVAAAIHAISRSRASLGRCFHLTAGVQNLTSLGDICELAARHLGRPKFAIVRPEVFEAEAAKREAALSEDQRDLLEEIRIYRPYLAGEVRFDDSGTRAMLGPSHPTAPKLGVYFGKMAEYLIAREAVE
jgi:thioester reductase-like protein